MEKVDLSFSWAPIEELELSFLRAVETLVLHSPTQLRSAADDGDGIN
jgi:hypothetical protein